LNKNKISSLLLISIVLLTILTSAIKLTLDSFNQFYNKSNKAEKQILEKICDGIYNFPPIILLRSYSGLETGYGFFGPNVSSDFVLLYNVYDSNDRLITSDNFKLYSKEGSLRFMSINRLFLDKITNDDNPKYNRYVEVILKQIAKHIAKDFPKKYTVKLYVYLYDFGSIDDFNNSNQAKLYLIKDTLWKN
jgi:hypothetical protein